MIRAICCLVVAVAPIAATEEISYGVSLLPPLEQDADAYLKRWRSGRPAGVDLQVTIQANGIRYGGGLLGATAMLLDRQRGGIVSVSASAAVHDETTTLTGLPPAKYRLTFESEGSSYCLDDVDLTGGKPQVGVAITLSAPRTISGVVTGIPEFADEYPVLKLGLGLVCVPIKPDGSFSGPCIGTAAHPYVSYSIVRQGVALRRQICHLVPDIQGPQDGLQVRIVKLVKSEHPVVTGRFTLAPELEQVGLKRVLRNIDALATAKAAGLTVSTTAHQDGTFEIYDLPDGDYDIGTSAFGGCIPFDFTPAAVSIHDGKAAAPVEIRLR